MRGSKLFVFMATVILLSGCQSSEQGATDHFIGMNITEVNSDEHLTALHLEADESGKFELQVCKFPAYKGELAQSQREKLLTLIRSLPDESTSTPNLRDNLVIEAWAWVGDHRRVVNESLSTTTSASTWCSEALKLFIADIPPKSLTPLVAQVRGSLLQGSTKAALENRLKQSW